MGPSRQGGNRRKNTKKSAVKNSSSSLQHRPAASEAQLTPKQKNVLEFIHQFRVENGYAPSQQEIAKNFGFTSLGTVQNYLVRLERQGVLQKSWNAKRGVLIPINVREDLKHEDPHRLPMVGYVAAGVPIEAIAHQEWVEVPSDFTRGMGTFFVLKVRGDSMIEDGILNGDQVIIKKQPTALNGQTVVALLDNQATIKRFFKYSDRVELQPANPAFAPIVVSEEMMREKNFRIEGVLAGVMRRF